MEDNSLNNFITDTWEKMEGHTVLYGKYLKFQQIKVSNQNDLALLNVLYLHHVSMCNSSCL
jgi:hypothetical protein